MTARGLARLLVAYVVVLVLVATAVRSVASLRAIDGEHVASAWRKGELVTRAIDGGSRRAMGSRSLTSTSSASPRS